MTDHIDKIVVASIDILGISKMLEYENGSKKVIKKLYNAWMNSGNIIFKKPDMGSEQISMFWGSTKFGDSIYFFGNPDDTIEKQTEFLIFRTGILIAIGISTLGILFRCGIAEGDLELNKIKIPTFGGTEYNEILIGTSMSRAHKLEINQKWIGGAISGNIDCKKIGKYLIKYKDIPINKKKFKKEFLPDYAINWYEFLKDTAEVSKFDINTTEERIISIAKDIGINDGVTTKINNTKKFLEFINSR